MSKAITVTLAALSVLTQNEPDRRQHLRELPTVPVVLESIAVADQQPSPEEQLITAELHERLRVAVAALPERERIAIEGFMNGEPEAEVAERLGVDRTTEWRIRQRALERLRQALGDDDADPPDAS